MTVSGLLITKNNGTTLDLALASVREYLDELVIIDDFSTDNTVEIAKKYDARVIEHKFEDFSKQRNFGIGQCKGDWIFTMDADEVMGENIGEAFPYLTTHSYRAFLFARYNLVNLDPIVIINSPMHYSEWQVRMFINDGKCYYQNPVHHQLQVCHPRLKIPNINIFHLHYLLDDRATRESRVRYYESIEKGAGGERAYLFEDYPHTYRYGIEKPAPEIYARMKKELHCVPYDYTVDPEEQRKFERNIKWKTRMTKARFWLGI